MSSTRLPGKNMLTFHRADMIEYVLQGALKSKLIDKVIIALPDEEDVKPIVEKYKEFAYICKGIPVNDLLSRYYHTIKRFKYNPINVIRLTSDCPLLRFYYKEIDKVIHHHIKNGYDFTHNRGKNGAPSGIDVEVMKYEVLKASFEFAGPDEREHVTTWIKKNSSVFKIQDIPSAFTFKWKWSIDTQEDFDRVEDVFKLIEMRKFLYETK